MAAGEFSRRFLSSHSRAVCWDTLTDAERLAEWVDIVGEVAIREPLRRYGAVLESRIGPFRLRADLDIWVVHLDEGRSIRFEAEGEDRQIGSRLRVQAGMHLEDEAGNGGTHVDFDGNYTVEGRVATMGASIVKKKGDAIFEQFFDAAQRELGR